MYKHHLLTAFIVMTLSACGGGGGSSPGAVDPASNGTNNQAIPEPQPAGDSHIKISGRAITLDWSEPNKRANDTALTSDQIQSYALVVIPYTQLLNNAQLLPEQLQDIEDFFNQGAQLRQVLSGEQVQELLEQGNTYISLIDKGETNFTINDLDSDYYYLAIATVDTNYLYGQLSKTISVHLTP